MFDSYAHTFRFIGVSIVYVYVWVFFTNTITEKVEFDPLCDMWPGNLIVYDNVLHV